MGAVKAAWLCGWLLCAVPAAGADPVDRWRPLIAEASQRFALPVEWIERVIRAESGGRTALSGRPIVSHAGAMGLMQLMPATWQAMRARLGLGADPHAPRDNILAGTAYLRLMYDRFGYPGLFAAYNAGPARYARHLATGAPLPAETQAYLAITAGEGDGRGRPGPVPAVADRQPVATLFAIRQATAEQAAPTPAAEPVREAGSGLFAVRRSALR